MNIEGSGRDYIDEEGKILTFVVGAACALRCAFCIVKQRGEILERALGRGDDLTI
jgi:hypothetical protein